MPQLLIKQLEMHSQFTTRHLLLEEQQQQQQVSAGQEQAKKPPTTTKVTKVRRQRQSRNPQLSVARRNERERNRVKMVNNGFALLRDHLPVEYLQQTQSGPGSQSGNHFGYESAGSETPDLAGAKSPACSSSAGGSKAKKFSKVETLRAAIQHIRMLEELIRESEPGFESINIQQQDSGAFDEMDGSHQMHRATSEDGPLSCASSGSLGTATNSSCSLSIAPAQLSMHHQIHHQIQPAYSNANTQPEQFVKLEPLAQQQIHFAQQQQQPASPMETARTTITTTTTVNTNQDQQLHYSQAPLMTQVHHHHHQQQQQDNSQIETSEHTHLWIQQHQSSFMEQQMQMQQQQYNNNQSQAWSPYQQQQQQQQFVQQHQHSPSMAYISHQPQTQTQTQMTFNSQLDSSPASHWFAPSPPSSIGQQQQQPASAFNQQHQISLYSQ